MAISDSVIASVSDSLDVNEYAPLATERARVSEEAAANEAMRANGSPSPSGAKEVVNEATRAPVIGKVNVSAEANSAARVALGKTSDSVSLAVKEYEAPNGSPILSGENPAVNVAIRASSPGNEISPTVRKVAVRAAMGRVKVIKAAEVNEASSASGSPIVSGAYVAVKFATKASLMTKVKDSVDEKVARRLAVGRTRVRVSTAENEARRANGSPMRSGENPAEKVAVSDSVMASDSCSTDVNETERLATGRLSVSCSLVVKDACMAMGMPLIDTPAIGNDAVKEAVSVSV